MTVRQPFELARLSQTRAHSRHRIISNTDKLQLSLPTPSSLRSNPYTAFMAQVLQPAAAEPQNAADDNYNIPVISSGLEAEDVDWNSADQVASHVSRTTLGLMQQLWRTHGQRMDHQGRDFAEKVFALHAQALKDVASMKTLELKQVAGVVNTYTTKVRELVLDMFKVMRQSDDSFAQGLYQTSRRAFTRNLREALDAKDAACADKVRRITAQHEQALATQRAAARATREQDLAAIQQDVMRELKEENRRKLAEAIRGITSQLSRQYAKQAALEEEAGPVPHMAEPDSASGGRPATTGRLTGTPHTDDGKPSTPTTLASSDETHGTLINMLPDLPSDGSSISLDVLQALVKQDDDNIGSVLARKEMEATIKASTQAVEELKAQVEELKATMEQERSEAEAWKDKWGQESGKTAALKRECLQIIVKCERKVKELQQQHVDDLEKRDALLQRAKQTIQQLEKMSQADARDQQHTHGNLHNASQAQVTGGQWDGKDLMDASGHTFAMPPTQEPTFSVA